VGAVEGVWVFKCRKLGQAFAQAGPAFGYDNAVLRIAGLIADGAGKTGADIGGIYFGAKARNVLGALVVDARDAVVEEKHGESATVFRLDIVAIEEHAIDDAAGLHEEFAPRPLEFFGGGALAQDEPGSDGANGDDGGEPGGNLPCVTLQESHVVAGRSAGGPQFEDTAEELWMAWWEVPL
jgi:hypothetical protein